MADPVVHITNGIPDSGTGNITTLGQTLVDGANATLGATTDAAIVAGATGTISAKLRSISRDILTNIVLAAGTAIIGKVGIDDGTNVITLLPANSGAPAASVVALPVSLRDSNTNGRKTPSGSAPVIMASQAYNTVAASQTAQALTGGGGGATGDWLDFLLIIPATTSPGAVTVTDGSGSAITVFAGGASSISSLVPFTVPIRAVTTSGAWKVTTGTNVSVIAAGNFT